jgi:hypothetical protein
LTAAVGYDRISLERNNYGHNTIKKNSWRPGGDSSAGEARYAKVWKKESKLMTIKELEKEIKEKITVLDKDELKRVIKFIDQIQENDLLWANDTINHLKKWRELSTTT